MEILSIQNSYLPPYTDSPQSCNYASHTFWRTKGFGYPGHYLAVGERQQFLFLNPPMLLLSLYIIVSLFLCSGIKSTFVGIRFAFQLVWVEEQSMLEFNVGDLLSITIWPPPVEVQYRKCVVSLYFLDHGTHIRYWSRYYWYIKWEVFLCLTCSTSTT